MQDIRILGANYTNLRVSTQVGSLADMLDNPHHKDELFHLGLRPGTIFACGIDFLLRLRPEALAPFQAELQARACMLTIAPLAVLSWHALSPCPLLEGYHRGLWSAGSLATPRIRLSSYMQSARSGGSMKGVCSSVAAVWLAPAK